MNAKVSRFFYRTVDQIKIQMPTILTIFGMAGVVTTSVLASKATLKAQDILNQKKMEENLEILETKEVILAVLPSYIPAIISGVVTMACMGMANHLSKKQQSQLALSYISANEILRNYKDKVNEIAGFDVKDKMMKEDCKEYKGNYDFEPEEDMYFDEYRGEPYAATREDFLEAQLRFHQTLCTTGMVTLNDFYQYLGISTIPLGDDYVWYYEDQLHSGYLWVNFLIDEVDIGDGTMCNYINFYAPAVSRIERSRGKQLL